MKKRFIIQLLLCIFFCPIDTHAQNKILFAGNVSNLCFEDDRFQITNSSIFPDTLTSFDAIFIFSGAESIFIEKDIENIIDFLDSGKGIYLGSDNWPLQVESNQVTSLLFSKQTWGNFSQENAIVSKESGLFIDKDSVPAGTTTVSFPLDYRLQVVAWVDDEPLIQAGELLGGKIIVDGGYSRFYCSDSNEENTDVLVQFLNYLIH